LFLLLVQLRKISLQHPGALANSQPFACFFCLGIFDDELVSIDFRSTLCFRTGHLFTNFHERRASSQILSPCLLLILIAIHSDRPEQMRERELGELPLAVLLDINLSHHERIGDFVRTDCSQQINVL
jgi:hypothetical protein